MIRWYFYKKRRRDYVPVEDEKLNDQAKEILNTILSGRSKFHLPEKFCEIDKNNIALFHSKGDLKKVTSIYIINEDTTFELTNKLNELTSKEWLTETVTVFAQRGLGASSKDAQIEKLHPAPFSFQDVGRLMKFFTKSGNLVLDPFCGVASTLKACAFENRIGYGIELNKKYIDLSKQRLDTEIPNGVKYKSEQHLIHGDSLIEIKKFPDSFFDFIITSPPYWNILETIDHKARQTRINENLDIKYSEDIDDLSNIPTYDNFLLVLGTFFDNCKRILKPNKYLCIIVSDFRKKEKYYMFHSDLAREIEKHGSFQLKGIKILHQRHKSIYPYGYPFSFVPNIHHQNVLIFQNNP